jgi:hypothetical protein
MAEDGIQKNMKNLQIGQNDNKRSFSELPPDLKEQILQRINTNSKMKANLALVNKEFNEEYRDKLPTEFWKMYKELQDSTYITTETNRNTLLIDENTVEFNEQYTYIYWNVLVEVPIYLTNKHKQCLLKKWPFIVQVHLSYGNNSNTFCINDIIIRIDTQRIRTLKLPTEKTNGLRRSARAKTTVDNGCSDIFYSGICRKRLGKVDIQTDGIPTEWFAAVAKASLQSLKNFNKDYNIDCSSEYSLSFDEIIKESTNAQLNLNIRSGGEKPKATHNGKKYVIHIGSKGGKYIIVKKRKIYVK